MGTESIKERVMKLLTKAGDPAASGAEAMACMTKARKLMDQHGFSEDDCKKASGDDFTEFSWKARMSPKHGAIFHPVERLCGTMVAKFCGCRMFFVRDGKAMVSAKFFGLDNDVELAKWMIALLKKQFDRDWENYVYLERKNKSLKTAKSARIAFSAGFAKAINARLEDWLYRKPADLDGYDNALVHQKQDIITDELARRGIVVGSRVYAGPKVTDGLAAGAGFNSGSASQWSTGVYHGRPQIMIGKD